MQIGTVFGRLWASLYHTGRPRLITVRGASKVTGAFAGGEERRALLTVFTLKKR